METQFQGCFCESAKNFSAIFEYSYRSMFLQSFVKIGDSPPRSVPCETLITLDRTLTLTFNLNLFSGFVVVSVFVCPNISTVNTRFDCTLIGNDERTIGRNLVVFANSSQSSILILSKNC